MAQWEYDNRSGSKTRKEIAKLEQKIYELKFKSIAIESKQEEIEEMKKACQDLRSIDVLKLKNFAELQEVLKERVASKINEYIGKASVSGSSARDHMEESKKMKAFLEDVTNLQRDPSLNLNISSREIADFKFQIQKSIEDSVARNITEVINSLDQSKRIEKGAFAKLEKDIEPFFAKDKLTTKEGRDIVYLILNTLKDKKDKIKNIGVKIYINAFLDEKQKQLGIKI
jgi:hypothetical protein